jgi:hypothetical protein
MDISKEPIQFFNCENFVWNTFLQFDFLINMEMKDVIFFWVLQLILMNLGIFIFLSYEGTQLIETLQLGSDFAVW